MVAQPQGGFARRRGGALLRDLGIADHVGLPVAAEEEPIARLHRFAQPPEFEPAAADRAGHDIRAGVMGGLLRPQQTGLALFLPLAVVDCQLPELAAILARGAPAVETAVAGP